MRGIAALAPSFAFKPGKNALLYFAGVVVVVVVVIVDVELGGSLFDDSLFGGSLFCSVGRPSD